MIKKDRDALAAFGTSRVSELGRATTKKAKASKKEKRLIDAMPKKDVVLTVPKTVASLKDGMPQVRAKGRRGKGGGWNKGTAKNIDKLTNKAMNWATSNLGLD